MEKFIMTACIPTREVERTLSRQAVEIVHDHRDVLRELRLELIEGGLILRGTATRFYGVQIALHEVKRRCGLEVLANRIVVASQSPPNGDAT